MACDSATGITWKHRHDLVVASFLRVCQRYALAVGGESTLASYGTDARFRPDGCVFLPPLSIAFDVAIVNVVAPSRLAREIAGHGKSLDDAADVKRRKYDDGARRMGANHRFVPLVVSIFGCPQEAAVELVNTIGAFIAEADPSRAYRGAQFVRDAWATIGTAIAQGNAGMLLGSPLATGMTQSVARATSGTLESRTRGMEDRVLQADNI
jgi:hypothetical protein